DVDGRRGYRNDPEFENLGAEVLTVEESDAAVVLLGDVDTDVIDSMAQAMTLVDGAPVIDPSGLPEGWVRTDVTGVDALVGVDAVEPDDAKIVSYSRSVGDA